MRRTCFPQSEDGQAATEYAVACTVVLVIVFALASVIDGLRGGGILEAATQGASHAVGSVKGVVGFVFDILLY